MPYLECRMLTIHPCKHSDVLKRFNEQAKAKGKAIKPYQSLVVFLKFMSSIMPTIRYDQTLDVEVWEFKKKNRWIDKFVIDWTIEKWWSIFYVGFLLKNLKFV